MWHGARRNLAAHRGTPPSAPALGGLFETDHLIFDSALCYAIQRRPTYKVSFLGGRVPLDLRFRGLLEAKSFVRAPKIDPQGRVFDLKGRSCGYDRRNSASGPEIGFMGRISAGFRPGSGGNILLCVSLSLTAAGPTQRSLISYV